jgi:hypothetical protein
LCLREENTEHGDIPRNICILKTKLFAEQKDEVILVVEHQSVIARDRWELKMDEVWGRKTLLALAALKRIAPSEFVL